MSEIWFRDFLKVSIFPIAFAGTSNIRNFDQCYCHTLVGAEPSGTMNSKNGGLLNFLRQLINKIK